MKKINWRKVLKDYNEWLSLPLALVLFVFAPKIYRSVDATAGAYDIGTLHILVVSAICVLFASGMAWAMMKLNFPTLYKYWDDKAEDDAIRKPQGHAAIMLSFGIYFAYFFAFLSVMLLFA